MDFGSDIPLKGNSGKVGFLRWSLKNLFVSNDEILCRLRGKVSVLQGYCDDLQRRIAAVSLRMYEVHIDGLCWDLQKTRKVLCKVEGLLHGEGCAGPVFSVVERSLDLCEKHCREMKGALESGVSHRLRELRRHKSLSFFDGVFTAIDEGRYPGVDLRLLFHIHGSHFSGGTYKGNLTANILKFLIAFLRFKEQGGLSTPAGRRLLKLYEGALEIEEKFFKLSKSVSGRLIDDFREFLRFNLAKLDVGESILIPGGWKDLEGGHAMYYEIVRQKKGYLFRVYNAGDGLEYHPSKRDEKIEVYATTISWKGVALETLLCPLFLRGMVECRVLLRHPQTEELTNWGPKDLYEGVFQLLDGKPTVEARSREDLKDPQMEGICTLRSAWEVMDGCMARGNSRSRVCLSRHMNFVIIGAKKLVFA